MENFDTGYREVVNALSVSVFGRVLNIIARSEQGRNEQEQGNMEFLEENGFDTSLLNSIG